MLSRIAESLFWMARYTERIDGMLRNIHVNYLTSLDESDVQKYKWNSLLATYTNLSESDIEAIGSDTKKVLLYIISDKRNDFSIINTITRARENARGVQDHITKEVWEGINEYYQIINNKDIQVKINNGEQLTVINQLLRQSALIYGLAEITMPRGDEWNFMNIGKFIERMIQTTSLLDNKLHDINYDINNPYDLLYWKNTLLSLSGYEYYTKTYYSGLQTQNILDMIIFNTKFPRSILYCTKKVSHILLKLTTNVNNQYEKKFDLEKLIGRLESNIEYTDIQNISQIGLHNYLSNQVNGMYEFNNLFSKKYFSYQ